MKNFPLSLSHPRVALLDLEHRSPCYNLLKGQIFLMLDRKSNLSKSFRQEGSFVDDNQN